MRHGIGVGATVMLLSAVTSWEDIGFDQRYERDYNIFNPVNQYDLDHPLNPANKYNPDVPFGPLDGQDDRDEGPSYFVSHRTVIRCSTA